MELGDVRVLLLLHEHALVVDHLLMLHELLLHELRIVQLHRCVVLLHRHLLLLRVHLLLLLHVVVRGGAGVRVWVHGDGRERRRRETPASGWSSGW